MKFSTILGALILAEAALAAPGKGQELRRRNREARRIARAAGTLKTGPMIQGDLPAGLKGSSNVKYSNNWAGAVTNSKDITEVTGTATVPSVSSGSGSAWVGIDGDSCAAAILQTGFQWVDGKYEAWYEWYPADSVTFDIDVSAGDEIKMTVEATSKTAGSATIENLTTGKTVSKTFSGETDALCETDAEWIVEDFEECNGSSCSLVPFGDFGTVTFTGAEATIGGSTVAAADTSFVIDIESQSNKVLTDCSISGSTVTCAYSA